MEIEVPLVETVGIIWRLVPLGDTLRTILKL